jgi:NAD(P)-dependent dehydrogenase (short-subunit alcohol dehydrogenase family)
MSVWFVTGASRGFGAEIVDKALAGGPERGLPARCWPSERDTTPHSAQLVGLGDRQHLGIGQ